MKKLFKLLTLSLLTISSLCSCDTTSSEGKINGVHIISQNIDIYIKDYRNSGYDNNPGIWVTTLDDEELFLSTGTFIRFAGKCPLKHSK